MVNVAIIGASGYTGADALRLLLGHPLAKVTYLTALPEECGNIADIFGQFTGRYDLNVEPLDLDKLSKTAQVVLCCLPHKVSMGFVPDLLAAGQKVIDFSADYRLRDVATYESFYSVQHVDTENIKNAAFGLPEFFRDDIKGKNLIANPGCYPTGAMLAAGPLLKNKLIDPQSIIVSSVTGVSGAGNKPNVKFHFPNMNENLFAYGVGTHRHMPEMEQIASDLCGCPSKVLFQPHVGPFDRGILSSVYMEPAENMTQDSLLDLYKEFYADEDFVQLCQKPPAVKDVAYTNYCHVYPAMVKGKVVVFSAIDNLVKGASGQAIQNMNIIFGLDEKLGLA